jgi:cupin superfamily acireductone dioxygenase involved in methionine salvage
MAYSPTERLIRLFLSAESLRTMFRCLNQKLLFSCLRGWFDSLVAVQGDLPVMTAKLRHWFLLRANPYVSTIQFYGTEHNIQPALS